MCNTITFWQVHNIRQMAFTLIDLFLYHNIHREFIWRISPTYCPSCHTNNNKPQKLKTFFSVSTFSTYFHTYIHFYFIFNAIIPMFNKRDNCLKIYCKLKLKKKIRHDNRLLSLFSLLIILVTHSLNRKSVLPLLQQQTLQLNIIE